MEDRRRDDPLALCSTRFPGGRLPAVRVVEGYRGHRIVTDGEETGRRLTNVADAAEMCPQTGCLRSSLASPTVRKN